MKVDQSLDDIVKQQKGLRARARGNIGKARATRAGGRPGRPRRRSFGRSGRRPSFGRNTFGSGFGGRARSRSPVRRANRSGADKIILHVGNLDYGVSDRDMRELFGEFGALKKAMVHYDKDGRSLGTAELIYESRDCANKAKKTYDGVPLDGRAMSIDFVGDRSPEPRRRGSVASRITPKRPSPRREFRGGARNGGVRNGGGRTNGGGRREEKKVPTADELDKELEAYLVAGAK